MNKDIDITKQLKCLIDDYDFNIETLSKYLKLNNNQIKLLASGDINFYQMIINIGLIYLIR